MILKTDYLKLGFLYKNNSKEISKYQYCLYYWLDKGFNAAVVDLRIAIFA